MQGNSSNNFFDSKVLGHPAGLFVLFFTEMWERFSYYGMRALLVLFLISSSGLGGWNWDFSQAAALFGTYTSLVYLTPIVGGYIADRIIGYRKAVLIGALLMTLGHGSMAMESEFTMYLGIALLIFGNGFFKPNMTSIISHMYKDFPEKKDGAYTIFYMGVNAGAFLGIMLCGYIGEYESWSYGFGLAGILMLMGLLQFAFAQKIFGTVGLAPKDGGGQEDEEEDDTEDEELSEVKAAEKHRNPFTLKDNILTWVSAVMAIVWIINDVVSKVTEYDLFPFGILNKVNDQGEIVGKTFGMYGEDPNIFLSGASMFILIGVILFLILLVTRVRRYKYVVKDKMIAVVFFAIFYIFFIASFEQAGTTMTLFASDFTERVMTGGWATAFIVIDLLITIIPLGIISYVLFRLFQKTYKKYLLSNIILGISFVFIWVIVIWKINRNMDSTAYVATYEQVETSKENKKGVMEKTVAPFTEGYELTEFDSRIYGETTIIEPVEMELGDNFYMIPKRRGEGFYYIAHNELDEYRDKQTLSGEKSELVQATVTRIKKDEVEIGATWFGILNSLFIIAFAPLFSRWWESKFNPSGPVKYGLGLMLIGIGFAALTYGASNIAEGSDFKASAIWLVIAYLFHTLGELCISPVGLSFVSKLVPGRMIAFMFGVWYLAIAIGNKLAQSVGGMVESIAEDYGISRFFLIFTLVPIILGVIAVLLNPIIKKFMHGVK
ncbi:peptide MFS transporter [Paracrocinitomix mangrovi]|uniref:peptide MFS transporter n=1 Tax=Paracrocinitomix mangrovi TaxID=2862509 RepID=UPI001C8EAE1E|nr:peptide MFS transporter [Paracrocinitomix mangrovi]UKN01740.1 peptide MFS transporter [Paracrocinitomix mangrovi]